MNIKDLSMNHELFNKIIAGVVHLAIIFGFTVFYTQTILNGFDPLIASAVYTIIVCLYMYTTLILYKTGRVIEDIAEDVNEISEKINEVSEKTDEVSEKTNKISEKAEKYEKQTSKLEKDKDY